MKCYLKKLAINGYDPIPLWRDEYDFKVPKDKFRLITGRYTTSTQSATTNNSMLRDMQSTNFIWINNKKAKEYFKKAKDINFAQENLKLMEKFNTRK